MQNLHHFTHRVNIQVYSVLQKLYLIRSWCDLFHDWYEIIIAKRVDLTVLITEFSKTRLQFILQHTKCSRKWWFLGAYSICHMFYSSRGFDSGSPPRNGAYNRKPYQAVKHLYMFVIDVGVAVLRKYGIGGSLQCKVIQSTPPKIVGRSRHFFKVFRQTQFHRFLIGLLWGSSQV